jgi:hypothetical protein
VSLFEIADRLRVSLSEYVRSMTGVMLPASMSSFRVARSFLFGPDE